MAVEILDVDQMLNQTFEPKRRYRWYLSIDGIDAFTLKTAKRPQITFDETVIEYINVKRYLAGKATWSTIPVTLYDPIAPSAAQKVMEWVRLCHDAASGRAGYAQMYQKDITLKLLGPVGDVVEKWTLKRCWAQDVDWQDLDFSSSDPMEINLTLRYDYAIQEW